MSLPEMYNLQFKFTFQCKENRNMNHIFECLFFYSCLEKLGSNFCGEIMWSLFLLPATTLIWIYSTSSTEFWSHFAIDISAGENIWTNDCVVHSSTIKTLVVVC